MTTIAMPAPCPFSSKEKPWPVRTGDHPRRLLAQPDADAPPSGDLAPDTEAPGPRRPAGCRSLNRVAMEKVWSCAGIGLAF